MRVKIRGRWWTISEEPLRNEWGNCYPSEREIILHPTQRPHRRLDTIVHELTLALYPDATEREAEHVARVMSAVLWKDGWRRTRGRAKT